MTLPKVPAQFETVEVGGAMFDLRAVKGAEAFRFHKMQEGNAPRDDLEKAIIAASTDTPPAEVADWYETTDRWAIEELIVHIKRISRLDEGAQKSG